jgi:hypothetical protein
VDRLGKVLPADSVAKGVGHDVRWMVAEYEGPVWFVANYATLCLRLVVRIEELTLGIKVRQSVASKAAIQTCPKSGEKSRSIGSQ